MSDTPAVMTIPVDAGDARLWGSAAAIALVGHAALLALVLGWARQAEPPVPEPVVLVELPSAPPAPSPQQASEQPRQQVVEPAIPHPRQAIATPLELPPVNAPLPSDPVRVSPPRPPEPMRASQLSAASASPPAPAVTAPSGTGTDRSAPPIETARAKKAQADYFSMVAAHLNRKKSYPTEAKKARQEGIVTVRFTVDRNGDVSNISIKRSSGHDLLDSATLDLLRRVAPLPRMPSSMQRDSVTIALPIDYSLRTS